MARDLAATSPRVNDAVSLSWYLAVLRERWTIVAVGAALGLFTALTFLTLTEMTYTARTVVNTNVIGSSPIRQTDAASRLIDISTEIELASSFEVASLASENLDGRFSAREIRDSVEVSTIADATVLVVNFTAMSADAAREGADAVAQGYLDYRSTVAEQRIDEAVAFIELRVIELRSELDDLAAELVLQVPDSEGELRIETDRSILLESLRTLLAQQFEFERIDTSAGRIISPAVENYVAVAPSRSVVVASGLLGGALLGVAAAFIVNATSRNVSTQRQLAAQLGRPSLGQVRLEEATFSAKQLEGMDVRAATARLVAELTVDDRSVVVVDATGDTTPSVLPFVLAASVAQSWRPVNVVVVGLSDHDQNRVIELLDLTPVAVKQRRPAFGLPIPSGVQVLFSPLEGGATELETAVEQAREHARSDDGDPALVCLVVVDQAYAHARLMTVKRADAVVLVSHPRRTSRRSIDEIVDMSEHFGCRIIGSVTAVPTRRGSSRNARSNRDRHHAVDPPDT